MNNEVDDADIADEGDECEENGHAGVEETGVKPPSKKDRGWRPSNREKEVQKLEDERSALQLLLERARQLLIMALQKAQAAQVATPAVKKCRTHTVLCDPR